MKLEAGHEVFYWDTSMVCGHPDARRHARVLQITDDPNYPIRFSSLVPLGPRDEVQVLSPYVSQCFRKLQDFILVPGSVKGKTAIESCNAAYAATYADMKQQHPNLVGLLHEPS